MDFLVRFGKVGFILHGMPLTAHALETSCQMAIFPPKNSIHKFRYSDMRKFRGWSVPMKPYKRVTRMDKGIICGLICGEGKLDKIEPGSGYLIFREFNEFRQFYF